MAKVFENIISHNSRVFLVLLVLAGICYANVLKGPLLFDDEHFIQKNQTVHNFDIPKIYSTGVTQGAGIGGNFYRPNQQLAFALIYQFFQLNPLPYHLVNILFHLGNAFLLFRLLLLLGFRREGAFAASLFYLVHPVLTEAVSYISGLADPMGMFFLLSGMIFWVKGLLRGKNRHTIADFVAAPLLFAAALLSKENMVVLLPLSLLLAWFLILVKKTRISHYMVVMGSVFLAMTVAYLYLKFSLFNFTGEVGLSGDRNIYTTKLWVRLLTFCNVIWEYVKMTFWPLRLNYEKPYTAYTTLLLARSFFGMAALAAWAFFAVRRRKFPVVFLGLSWFFFALAPYSGIIPLNAMFLEHWIYIPLAGLLILLAKLVDISLKPKWGKLLRWALPLVLVLFCGRTFARNAQWADIEKFYLNELKYTSSSIRIYNNLGMYYADRHQNEKAIEYYNKAIAASDLFPQPHHNLAHIYKDMGDPPMALKELYLALRIDPGFIYSLALLSELYFDMGQTSLAQQAYQVMLKAQNGGRVGPQDIDALFPMISPGANPGQP